MGNRLLGIIILVALSAGLWAHAGCVFGPNRYYAAIGNRNNQIFIRHNRWYYVGELPDDWQILKTPVKAVSWYNPHYRSTLSTDVFCERSVGDGPLKSFASQVAVAVANRTVTDAQNFMLDGRGALRERITGTVDGVPVVLDSVVTKKNYCSFNMVAIMVPEEVSAVEPIFDQFVNGFHYE